MRCHWLLLPLLIVAAACHGSPSEPTPALSGPYLLSQVNTSSCGGPSHPPDHPVYIQQAGDQISFYLGPDTGGVAGTIKTTFTLTPG